MPSRQYNEDKRFRAYQLSKDGFGPTTIQQVLVEEFENKNPPEQAMPAVKLRTVKNWLKEFRDLETLDLDTPADWGKLEAYDIPENALGPLLQLWSVYGIEGRPTIRMVKWWWRVHLALPDEPLGQVVLGLALHFIIREIRRDVLGPSRDLTDLWQCIALKPWSGPDQKKKYDEAVEKGHIDLHSVIPGVNWDI